MTDTEPQFVIDSMERADWLLRKLGNIAAEKARVKSQAAAILNELDNDDKSLRSYFGPQLEELIRKELATRGGKKKSITLLQGTCGFRSVPGGLRLVEPDAALSYALVHMPSVVQAIPKLSNEDYKQEAERCLREDGELLPGMEMVDDRESFSIRFAKDDAE